MKNKIILALALLSLVACNKKDSDKKPAETSRPLVSKPELTTSQQDEIRDFFAKANVMPSTDLLTDDIADSETKKAAIEKKVNALSSDQKQIYEKLKADCKIGKAEKKVTGELKEKNSERETKITASLSGDKCPIDQKWSSVQKETIAEGSVGPNQTLKSYSDTEQTTTIKMQDLQTQVGMKDTAMSISGASSLVIKDSKMASMEMTFTAVLKATTVKDQKLKLDMRVEMSGPADAIESYTRIDYEFPSSNPTLQVFRKTGDKETQYYLNGKKITAEKLGELMTPKSVPVIELPGEDTKSEISRKVPKLL